MKSADVSVIPIAFARKLSGKCLNATTRRFLRFLGVCAEESEFALVRLLLSIVMSSTENHAKE
jgi:hypothetical protein